MVFLIISILIFAYLIKTIVSLYFFKKDGYGINKKAVIISFIILLLLLSGNIIFAVHEIRNRVIDKYETHEYVYLQKPYPHWKHIHINYD